MEWFWLGILPFVLYLFLLWFIKAGINWNFDNVWVILAILCSWVPVLNWSLIGTALILMMIGYNDIPFKDNKFNRWLFGSRFRER